MPILRARSAALLQFFKYLISGGVAFGVDISMFLLARALGADLVSANVLARFTGAVAAYLLNHLWTFAKPAQLANWLSSSWRYLTLWVAATIISTSTLTLLSHAGVSDTTAKICVEALMPVFNFIITRIWVFR